MDGPWKYRATEETAVEGSMHPAAFEASGSRAAGLWVGLQLTRPANVVTAWADILAGAAHVAHGMLMALALKHYLNTVRREPRA